MYSIEDSRQSLLSRVSTVIGLQGPSFCFFSFLFFFNVWLLFFIVFVSSSAYAFFTSFFILFLLFLLFILTWRATMPFTNRDSFHSFAPLTHTPRGSNFPTIFIIVPLTFTFYRKKQSTFCLHP